MFITIFHIGLLFKHHLSGSSQKIRILKKRLHIDCFKKISNDYDEFLINTVVDSDREIGYDRIKRLGVTTLILHKKRNQIQNCWELTLPTQRNN